MDRMAAITVMVALLLWTTVPAVADGEENGETRRYVGFSVMVGVCGPPMDLTGACVGVAHFPGDFEGTYNVSIDDDQAEYTAGVVFVNLNDSFYWSDPFCDSIELEFEWHSYDVSVFIMDPVEATTVCGLPAYATAGEVTMHGP